MLREFPVLRLLDIWLRPAAQSEADVAALAGPDADADASPERPAVAAADDRAVGPAYAGAQCARVVAYAGAQRAADPKTDADPDAPTAGTHAEAIISADARANALALAASDLETDAGPDARPRRSHGRASLRADARALAAADAGPVAGPHAASHVDADAGAYVVRRPVRGSRAQRRLPVGSECLELAVRRGRDGRGPDRHDLLRSDGPADGGANTRADAIAEPRAEPRADDGANVRADVTAEPRAEPRADGGTNVLADVSAEPRADNCGAVAGAVARADDHKLPPRGLLGDGARGAGRGRLHGDGSQSRASGRQPHGSGDRARPRVAERVGAGRRRFSRQAEEGRRRPPLLRRGPR